MDRKEIRGSFLDLTVFSVRLELRVLTEQETGKSEDETGNLGISAVDNVKGQEFSMEILSP